MNTKKESYLVFIDESGDHNLNIQTLDNYYNTFVLCWVIFTPQEYELFDKKFRSMKKELFWREDFILHTSEITRPSRSKQKENVQFNSAEFRIAFYTRINALIQSLDIRIVYSLVDKNKLVDIHWSKAEDPYLLCFETLLNKTLQHCPWSRIEIYPERRHHVENIKLETEFLKLKTMWTEFYRWAEIAHRVKEFTLVDKYDNDSGIQLADLIVSPIGREFIGKKPRKGNEVDIAYIRKKIPHGWFSISPNSISPNKKKRPPAPQ